MVGESCSCDWLGERLQAALITDVLRQRDDVTHIERHGNDVTHIERQRNDVTHVERHSNHANDVTPTERPSPAPADAVVLLDCRPAHAYTAAHVRGALLVTLPSIVLRRLERGAGSVASAVPPERRAAFSALCRTGTVVLYNEAGLVTSSSGALTSSDALTSADALTVADSVTSVEAVTSLAGEGGDGTSSGAVMTLLLTRLEADGCRVRYLQGGFSAFQERYSHLCVVDKTAVDRAMDPASHLSDSFPHPADPSHRTDPAHPAHTPACLSLFQADCTLGLANLRLSTDCPAPGDVTTRKEGHTPGSAYPFPVQVLPYLFLGNAENSSNLACLDQHGIRYVLNVTPDIPNAFEARAEFKYMRIPILDQLSQNLQVHFADAINFIEEARGRQCGVLVHCLAGISRSVTVTVAYLMHREALCLDDAYEVLRRYKPNISPNFNFMGQLVEFEATLRAQRDLSPLVSN